jgi:glycosyltransferase involved in cell wall biosynthesis
VVLEAKACGLPVLVADHAATRQCIQKSGIDGYVLPTADPALWERTLRTLLAEPGIRRKIGTAARRTIETAWPSWRDVVEQDLLPVWQNTISQANLPAKTASPGSLADGMPSEAPAD